MFGRIGNRQKGERCDTALALNCISDNTSRVLIVSAPVGALQLGMQQHARHKCVVRCDCQCPTVDFRSFFMTIQVLQHVAFALHRGNEVRFDCQRLIEARERLRRAIQCQQCIAAVIQRSDVAGIDRKRLVVARQSFREPVQFVESDPAIGQCFRVVGLDRQCVVETR